MQEENMQREMTVQELAKDLDARIFRVINEILHLKRVSKEPRQPCCDLITNRDLILKLAHITNAPCYFLDDFTTAEYDCQFLTAIEKVQYLSVYVKPDEKDLGMEIRSTIDRKINLANTIYCDLLRLVYQIIWPTYRAGDVVTLDKFFHPGIGGLELKVFAVTDTTDDQLVTYCCHKFFYLFRKNNGRKEYFSISGEWVPFKNMPELSLACPFNPINLDYVGRRFCSHKSKNKLI